MSDVIDWTAEGLSRLAEERAWGPPLLRALDREELLARLETSVERFAPCWERGLAQRDSEGRPRADAAGRAAVAYAKQWTRSNSPTPSIVEAAGFLSLLGGRSDNHDGPLAELLVRDHGIAFVLRALVAMWSMATNYDDPDWPKSESRLSVWLFAIAEGDGDASWMNDASVSYGKATLADFLARRADAGTDAERSELLSEAEALFPEAPLYARPALACAAADRTLAERAMREIFAAKPRWYPHYARRSLANLIGDRALLDEMGFIADARPTLRFLERLGIDSLPIYEAMYRSKLTKHQREHLTKQLVNINGPSVAKLLAPYAEKAPYAAYIRAYFARAPALLALVRKDAALAPYTTQLDKLADKLAPKPAKSKRAKPAQP